MPDPSPCSDNPDCTGDFYCDTSAGECLPWGVGPGGSFDAECTRDVVAGVFLPDVQCEWLGPPEGDPFPNHINVLSSPMLADFRLAGAPELGRRPSIVFISYNSNNGGNCMGIAGSTFGVIRVIDGRSCEQQATIADRRVVATSSVALGDLNNDGLPEIVAVLHDGGLAAWTQESDGESFRLLWETLGQPGGDFGNDTCNWSGPAIHDLDDDGSPEVLLYGAVFDANGVPLNTDFDISSPVFNEGGYIPVVADVDADGQVELVTGTEIFGWNSGLQQWDSEALLGPVVAQTAVADLGTFGDVPEQDDRATLDGIAEIVTINEGIIRVFTVNGREVYTQNIPPGAAARGNGGPPTIADFDGDGRNEFSTAGGKRYSVFDLDCLGTPDPAFCASGTDDGILWAQVSQDESSNKTGSSVFDFEGDGLAEVVYSDECFTRVYEGTTGEVLYSHHRRSCTWYENPIIADTDADFSAEIVVTSNDNCNISCPSLDPIFDGIRCFDQSDCPSATACRREDPDDVIGRCRCSVDADCGGSGFVCIDPIAGPSAEGKVCRASHPGDATERGVQVLTDTIGRWVTTRPIWNQHAYSVTNVDDGGGIPRTSEWIRNWQDSTLNNFRQNAPGAGAGGGIMPDLTINTVTFECAGASATLLIDVCNRGTEAVGNDVKLSVYDGQQVVCQTTTPFIIDNGNCISDVRCELDASVQEGSELSVVIDDAGGASTSAYTECREDNNSFTVLAPSCP